MVEKKEIVSHETEQKTPRRPKHTIVDFFILFVIVAMLGVIGYSGYKLIYVKQRAEKNLETQSRIQSLFYERVEEAVEDSKAESREESSGVGIGISSDERIDPENPWPEELRECDFAKLLEVNQDTKGCICMPAAGVDHPVVQAEDNDYYLHRNFYGDYEFAGTLFMDYRCHADTSPCLVIYGHHMTDGTMFGNLSDYLDPEVGQANPYFWYITEDHLYKCEIFSTFITNVDEDYLRVYFDDAEDFLNFVEWARERSEYTFPEVEVKDGDQILLLSTCNSWRIADGSGRQVLYAKMTEYK